MSMRDYALSDYGIVFGENELRYAEKVLNKKNKTDYEYEDYEIGDDIGLEYISEFTGQAIKVESDGSLNWCDTIDCGEYVYYANLRKFPTLFNPAYPSIDDAVNELKERYGEYLPENYDYANNIRNICGTYFG